MYNQEYIVDEIIKKDLTKQYPELKKLIKKTSPHEIRGGIMSVLDKDRRVHRDIKFYENLNKECEYKTYTDEIVINVRKYIEVAACEVKLYAEVMTPIELVEDMLDKLPQEVWSNKDLKWLDPCCGVGTFPSVIVQRLMKGLEKQIPNPKKRYKHIIEEMIYVCEIQAKNLFAFHYVFDKPDIYELNTFYGSFLTDEFNEHMKNEWNIEKFDIIVGNPPYSEKAKEPIRLWSKFINKSYELISSNGLLLFVTPSSWISSTNSSYQTLKGKVSYVNLSNDVSKSFGNVGGSQKFIYFLSHFNCVDKCITKFDENIELELDPTATPIAPIKSSSYYDYTIVDKLYKSNLKTYNWYRTDKSDLSSGVVLPMAKSENYIVSHHQLDNFEISRYKVNVDESIGNILSNNLNLKLYKRLRWVLRSGAALAGNFKLLPIPNIEFDNQQLYDFLKLNNDEINYIETQTK